MSKTARVVSLLVLLLTVVVLNISVAATEMVAVASAEAPGTCYDMWQNCLRAGNHSAEYCDGVWCGCMQAKYGYSC